jgi:WD40 repeat protein
MSNSYLVRKFNGHTSWVRSVCVSIDGQYVISGSADKSIRVWSLSTGQMVRQLTGQSDVYNSVCVSMDGKYVISGGGHNYGGDNIVRVWSLSTGELVREFNGHTDGVSSVCVSIDGQYVISGSHDGSIRVWSLPFSLPLQSASRSVFPSPVSTQSSEVIGAGDNGFTRIVNLIMEQFGTISSRLDAMQQHFSGVDTRLDAMQQHFSDINTRLDGMQQNLSSLQGGARM